MEYDHPPRFVVLEGVDGSGKTALFKALAKYYETIFSNLPLYADKFPGTHPHTLGEWVYRFQRNQVAHAPSTTKVAPPALQMLHVAAHIDAMISRVGPTLQTGGNVLLDRCWWSTYAYSRSNLPAEQANILVAAERMFWKPLIKPVVIYVHRSESLKQYQITPERYKELDGYYREIIDLQRLEGITIHELDNDGPLENTWKALLDVLSLPYIAMENER